MNLKDKPLLKLLAVALISPLLGFLSLSVANLLLDVSLPGDSEDIGGLIVLLSFVYGLLLSVVLFRKSLNSARSIDTILVLSVLASASGALSWLSVKWHWANKQGEAVEAILRTGGMVGYDYQRKGKNQPPAPAWLRKVVGDDLFQNANSVQFRWKQGGGDSELEYVKELKKLKRLDLFYTPVTAAGLEQVKGLNEMEELSLVGSQITDAELEQLKGLANLHSLNLADTKISDAGLEHLKGLTEMKYLRLGSNQVTDAGLEHLKGLTKMEELVLHSAQITDVGLQHLKGMGNLQSLHLGRTDITDAGLIHLKGLTEMKYLNLGYNQVTDAGLEHLKGLTKLEYLFLLDTQVTGEGVKKLQEALPNCLIKHY